MAAPMEKVEKWICVEMSKLLGIDTNEELARYILSIETRPELEEYIYGFLDSGDPKQKRFINELLRRWRPPEREIENHVNLQAYRKTDEDPEYFSGPDKLKKKGKKGQNSALPSANASGIQTKDAVSSEERQNDSAGQRGKAKFVPLFGDEGQLKSGARLPGRHPCECQATKHKLINNCLKCGRVVCDQEGSGPCLFCGTLVCTTEELEVLNRGSKKSEKLRESLNTRGQGGLLSANNNGKHSTELASRIQENYEKAVKHKDRLLHYDKTSVKRTQVIDDESDYFTTEGNTWLSQKEKAALKKREDELREKKHGSRLDRKLVLDFAGRKVLDAEEAVDVYNINDDVVQEVYYGKSKKNAVSAEPSFKNEDFGELVNPNIKQDAPKFVPIKNSATSKKSETFTTVVKKGVRIQDRELQEMSDEGMCLSMHQPWASLLTNGIKIHEGRSWYTPHRGRLYIAATAKAPSPEELSCVEQQYRAHYNDATVEFPTSYPVGCLLGCVDVVDCLSEDDYSKKFPDGESSSPFVFICENPQELVVKFPIKGKHKIYKLESHIHQAAKRGLQPVHPKVRTHEDDQSLSEEGEL